MRLFLGTFPLFISMFLLTFHRSPSFEDMKKIFLRWMSTLLIFLVIMLIVSRRQLYGIPWVFFRDIVLPLLLGWLGYKITFVPIPFSDQKLSLRIIVLGSYALIQTWIQIMYGGQEISILYYMFLLPCSIACWPLILGMEYAHAHPYWVRWGRVLAIMGYWILSLGVIIQSFQYFYLGAIGTSLLLLCGVGELVCWEYKLFWHARS